MMRLPVTKGGGSSGGADAGRLGTTSPSGLTVHDAGPRELRRREGEIKFSSAPIFCQAFSAPWSSLADGPPRPPVPPGASLSNSLSVIFCKLCRKGDLPQSRCEHCTVTVPLIE